jgi:sulfide:quinone oxidoreductase
MARSPLRVVIAGGGAAGLETLLALRALAGDLVDLSLLAPEDEFVYRPLVVRDEYAADRIRAVPLERAAKDAEAAFVSASVDAVDPAAKNVTTSDGDQLAYDALVLSVGAQAVPVVEHALTWDDRIDADTIGGLLRDIEGGYSRSLAVIIPPGASWPLRGYELALFIMRDAKGVVADFELTIVTPEPALLELLGSRAVELMESELERAGVTTVSASRVDVVQSAPAVVVLEPGRRRLEFDRLLALPALRGRPIRGVPCDDDGFIDVDEHCRVRGLDSVWAAGDCIAFPLKSGGFATEQADVAAEDIAASAGAAVSPHAFTADMREELAGLPAGQYLESWLGAGKRRLATHIPSGTVPVLTYLRRDLTAGWRGRS